MFGGGVGGTRRIPVSSNYPWSSGGEGRSSLYHVKLLARFVSKGEKGGKFQKPIFRGCEEELE